MAEEAMKFWLGDIPERILSEEDKKFLIDDDG